MEKSDAGPRGVLPSLAPPGSVPGLPRAAQHPPPQAGCRPSPRCHRGAPPGPPSAFSRFFSTLFSDVSHAILFSSGDEGQVNRVVCDLGISVFSAFSCQGN